MDTIPWDVVELRRDEGGSGGPTVLEPIFLTGLRALAEWRATGHTDWWVIAPENAEAWEDAISFDEMEELMLSIDQIDWTEALIEAEPRPRTIEELDPRMQAAYRAALAAGWLRIEADDPRALDFYEGWRCVAFRTPTGGRLAKVGDPEDSRVYLGSYRAGYVVWDEADHGDAPATVEWWQAAAAPRSKKKK